MCHLLRTGAGPTVPKRIVELGAGDGTFMLRIARSFSRDWKSVEVILVDCKDAITNETRAGFKALGWQVESVAADVFDWLKQPDGQPADIMVANLFLHQFAELQLAKLLDLAAKRTKLFAACEPRRAAIPFALSRMVGLIGCNAVTQHDAPLSVRAGFAGQELSALWPNQAHWRLQERSAHFFSQTFLAQQIVAA